ncbi:MAG: hemerythrin domain-containing protein [Sulfolobaceae archaeon]|nr:hemerythrin domain-containing protein [Sulfolobaceae archaeon]
MEGVVQVETKKISEILRKDHLEEDELIAELLSSWDEEKFSRFFDNLKKHIYLEEEFLFPLIHGNELIIADLMRQHAIMWRLLEMIEKDREQKLHQVYSTLLVHNAIEESDIYPQLEELDLVIKVKEMPSDWKPLFYS